MCSGGYTQLGPAQVLADGDDVPAKVLEVVSEFWRCNNAACRKLYWEGPKFYGTRDKFTALLARVAGGVAGGGGGGGGGGGECDEGDGDGDDGGMHCLAGDGDGAGEGGSDVDSDGSGHGGSDGEGRGGGGSGSDNEEDYGEFGRGAPARAAEERASSLPRFIADERLKRLARWLRALGTDVAVPASGTTAGELVGLALDDRRTVITVDSERAPVWAPLLQQGLAVVALRGTSTEEQFREVGRCVCGVSGSVRLTPPPYNRSWRADSEFRALPGWIGGVAAVTAWCAVMLELRSCARAVVVTRAVGPWTGPHAADRERAGGSVGRERACPAQDQAVLGV